MQLSNGSFRSAPFHKQPDSITWPRGTSPSTYNASHSSSKQWAPDVNMLLATSQWLKLHGLKKYKLELKQILSSIGFKHCEEYVAALQKPVKASYSKGLFPQYAYADGTIYNLLATSEKLRRIESQLKQVIGLYQERLEWLTSASRLVFDVIQEQSVSIIVDLQCSSEAELDLIKNALTSLVKEQLLFVSRFNFIRCAPEIERWHERSVNVSTDSIEGVLTWIHNLKLEASHEISCTVEALLKAAEDVQVESIYLFTDGSCSVDTREVLKRKLQDLNVPVHIVALNCVSPSCLNFLEETARISRGRFHKFCLYDNNDGGDKTSLKNSATTELSEDFSEHGRLKLEVGVRQDVIALWEELDTARNTLAEIQAIQIHISQREPVVTNPAPSPMEKQENRKARTENELYMSSKEWLQKHSLKSTKLGFYDLLQNVAFRHCDGVVEVPNPRDDSNLATVKSKLVNARYCDKFAHVRWKDGQIFHVHISGDVHRNYDRRIMAVLDSYKQRIQWLQKGSRELFGTIIEDQVTILIDTSASMNSRLFLVKDKLYQLLQEQIKHKRKFNLIKFDSRVQAWRSRLVDCNDRNIDDAWQWIKGLVVGGSTNTLGALKLALSDPLCSAVYLLTDGRPDQPPLTILSQIHLQDPVPIHTISFNCSDESANEFLCKLSANTNARFHYFSEHGINEGDPKTFESEDLRLIREEIEKGVNDLQRLTRLRNWCAQLDWYGSNKNKTTSIRAVPRPSSAPLIRRPKKSSGAIFRRARSVKEKKVKRDTVKPETKDVSSKDSSSGDESIHSESVKSEESKLENLSNEEKEPLLESSNIFKETELDSAKAKKKKKKKTKEKSATSTQNDAEERRPIAKFPRQPKTQTNYRGIGDDSARTNGDVKHKGRLNPTQKAAEGERPRGQWLRNHKVLARNDVDGFYYPGILRTNINSRYADVAFCDFESQIVCLRYIIPNEGARPCPSLKVGDYVLVKTLREGGLPCYVPGVVYVVPLRQSKATKYYTIIHYNGRKNTSLRKDLVKISQSRYTFACRYIKDCEITANKSPSISVFSLEAKKKNKSEKKDVPNSSSDSDDRDKGSGSQDDKLDDNVAKHKDHNKKDSDEHGSSEENVDSSPKSSINQELERIKQALSETRESQLKSFEEQQDRFDDLRQQLKDAMEDQSRRQEELKNQYDELKESRCKGDGTDEDLQDKQLEEARKLLEEQQENMIKDFKKHQKLLEELLHQQAPVKTNPTSLPDDKQKRKRKKKKNKQSSEGSSGSSSDSGSSSSSSNSPRDSPRVQSPEQPGHLAPKEDVEAPATLQFHVSSSEKEACLWTKGSHGLLISRVPLEEDPAVENRHVPTRLQSGEEVLARWSDDGWYYRGTVHEPAGDNYFVEDSVGNMEEIPRQNIISDEDDAGNVIQVNDAAVALHPSFPFSYAPGVVVNVEDDLLYTVRFYDGQEDAIPREEVYYLTHEKFSSDVNFIVRCEESLVGQAVVARNDANGLFYLANIRERVGNGRQYVVQWPDGSTQVQSSALIFGAHTKRHQLAMGDRVLALSNAADGLYEPGWITGVSGKKLSVKFSTGKRSCQVDPMQCFWLSSDYYDRIVDYITKNNRK